MIALTGNDLIGAKSNPVGFSELRQLARTAKAYDALVPYPNYSAMTNKRWLVEEMGPYPRCLPFVRRLVTKGARWLFGKPLTFRCDSDEMSKALNDAWTQNSMGARSVPMARLGALAGGVALKWSWDPQRNLSPQIHVLDPSEHTRFYFDPHDQTRLLMVRVQYPYFDPRSGKQVWYREEWTDEKLVVYRPVEQSVFTSQNVGDPYQIASQVDVSAEWQIESEGPNEFGIIPLWYVQNIPSGREYGDGDLWPYFHVVDLVNFTRDLEHKHNQKGQDPSKTYIDLEAEPDDAPGRDRVAETLRTATDSQHQGKVQEFAPDATMRPHLKGFGDDILHELLQAVGSVDVRMDEITNKGNLTRAVLEQVYAPLIEATDEKRKSYGEDGLCTFFERMSRGLASAGVPGWAEIPDVQVQWPDYFQGTPEEKKTEVERQALMVQSRFTTPERAVRAIAAGDGVIDTDELEAEIALIPEPAPDGDSGGDDSSNGNPEERAA